MLEIKYSFGSQTNFYLSTKCVLRTMCRNFYFETEPNTPLVLDIDTVKQVLYACIEYQRGKT